MYDVEKYLDNPDILQTIHLLMEHDITLLAGNDLTEEIVLQLINENYIKEHFRTAIELASLVYVFSELEIELLVDLLFNNPHIEISKLDYMTELLTGEDRALLQLAVHTIHEEEVIIDYLLKPSLTENEMELLRAYYHVMKNDPHLEEIELEAVEVFEAFSDTFEKQLNDFWKERLSVHLSATPKKEVKD